MCRGKGNSVKTLQRQFLKWQVWVTGLLCLLLPAISTAEPVCAVVKIEIQQELTLERQAFDARMVINNGLDTLSIDDLSININFTDENGLSVLASSDPNNTTAKFFIRVDSMQGVSDITGTGSIAPLNSAEIHWLIIPAPGAADAIPSGKLYFIGASLDYTVGGQPESVTVTPDSIYVKPLPLLTLDYFLERDVYADDAFTPEVEPSEPFTLGVRIRNNGAAPANNVAIDSAQPRIVENEQGLLIGFNIIGSYVNEQPVTNSLFINFGNIAPNESTVGRWDMMTTLSGRFTDFTASVTHADELGGQLTSIIDAANTYTLIQDVLVDLPGRDGIRDFLAYPNGGSINSVTTYESDNVDSPVANHSTVATLIFQSGTTQAQYSLTMPQTTGLAFARLVDPQNGQYEIKQVIRSDGKYLPTPNAWTSRTRNLNNDPPTWDYWVNFFDSNSTGSYTVVMGPADIGPVPPVLTPLNNVTTWEGNPTSFPVSATDPNGDTVTLSVSGAPAGSDFAPVNGSGIFNWTPATGQAGLYPVTFTATDPGGLGTSQTMFIQVNPENDTDGDGLDDQWEIDNFGDLSRDGTGDFDGDGITDLQEFLDGTDPTVAGLVTGQWGTPEDVETSSAGDATQPTIAVASDGAAMAVWQQFDGTLSRIYANTYTAASGWGVPVLIDTNTGDARSPHIAMDANNNAMVVWLQSDGSVESVWANYYQTASGWGTATLVESDDVGNAAYAKVIMTSSGEAVAIWSQADGALNTAGRAMPNTVMSNRFVPATGWGTTAIRIEANAVVHVLKPDISVDASDNVMVLWTDTADNVNFGVHSNIYSNATGWSAAQSLRSGLFTEASSAQITAQLAMNESGDAIAVWHEAASPDSVWAVMYFAATGWGVAEAIETELSAALQPVALMDATGNALVAWVQSDGTRFSVRANRFTAATGWATAELISTADATPVNGNATAPQLGQDAAGNILVGWQQTDGLQNNIWTNRYSITDTAWQGAQIVEISNAGDALNPVLAVHNNGEAYLVWQQFDGTTTNIQANRYDGDNTGVPNIAPVVVAADVTADELSNVVLDGSGSFDQDGAITTYAWVQTSGTSLSLINANTAIASFTAPTVLATDGPQTFTFTLTVTDDQTASSTQNVTVTINPVNAIPVANAGIDQTTNEQTTVTLDGTGSSDSDGTIASYAWTQTAGTTVTLSGANTATATFTTPVVLIAAGPQTLTFQLTVTDNEGATASDTITVTVNPVNANPTANAGVDLSVNEQTPVTLTGAGTDSDGTIVSYAWTQTGGPVVTLTNANTAMATFTTPVVLVQDGPQVLTFQLMVTDNEGATASDTITVTVNPVNANPVSNAGVDQSVNEQMPVTLTGSGTDSDGTIVSYAWTQTGGPVVTLTGANTANASFTSPVVLVTDGPQVLSFQLIVTDNEGATASDTITVTVNPVNALPVIDAGANQSVNEQTPVSLSATATDSDGTIASYVWTQTAGTTVTLTGADTATPNFTAPVVLVVESPMTLIFQLTVTDNEGAVVTDTVNVSVIAVNAAPVVTVGADQTVPEYIGVTLSATATDSDGSIGSYLWSQISGPAVTLTNANMATATFTAPPVYQTTTLSFQLTVIDNEGSIVLSSVNVTVTDVNPDDDNDGLADLWEIEHFGDLDQDGSGDADGDGFSDLQEYAQGTNPNALTLAPPNAVEAKPDNAQVALSWNTVPSAVGYNVYWRTSPEVDRTNGNLLANVNSGVVHTGLANGTVYYYVVTTLSGEDESAESLEVSAIPGIRTWQTPVTLDDATYVYNDAQIDMNAQGEAMAVWKQYDGTAFSTYARYYNPQTGWGVAQVIETGNNGHVFYPQVAMSDNGSAVAVWEQYDGTYYHVWSNYYDAQTGWGVAERVETHYQNGTLFYYPEVGIDQMGNVIAVWQKLDGADLSIWANRYEVGTGWGTAGVIEYDDDNHAYTPEIAMNDSGKAVVAWEHRNGYYYQVQVAEFDPLTGWTNPQRIDNSSGFAFDPAVDINSQGDAVVVWEQYVNGNFHVWSNNLVAGSGWGTPQAVENNASASAMYYRAKVSMDDNGSAIAVWQQYDGSALSVWSNRRVNGTWGAAQIIDPFDTSHSYYPRIAMTGDGDAMVVWQHIEAGEILTTVMSTWATRYSPDTGWGASRPIEYSNASITSGHQVAMDEEGDAMAIWHEITTTGLDINVAHNALQASPPNADAGVDQSVFASDSVTLDAQGSSDAEGAIDSYSWYQLSDEPLTLSGQTSSTLSFQVPPHQTVLTFLLVVSDIDGNTAVDTVTVNVLD